MSVAPQPKVECHNKIMKSFKKYILEKTDRTALPPPTVIYPGDMESPPDEALQPAQPLPPNIDWKGVESLISMWHKLREFYDRYGWLDANLLRMLAQMYGLNINSFLNQFNITADNFFSENLRQSLIDYFERMYPDASAEQQNRFYNQLDDYFDPNVIPQVLPPAESDTDWDPGRTPRNQPKPKPNLPRRPFWPGHADGVVG